MMFVYRHSGQTGVERGAQRRFTAMAEVIRAAHASGGRLMIRGPATDTERFVRWTSVLAAELPTPLTLTVAGPRATRWHEGVAWQPIGAASDRACGTAGFRDGFE